MRVIQNLMAEADATQLKGTIIAVPVVNVPGYLMNTRQFNDGQDLNRVMPGQSSAGLKPRSMPTAS